MYSNPESVLGLIPALVQCSASLCTGMQAQQLSWVASSVSLQYISRMGKKGSECEETAVGPPCLKSQGIVTQGLSGAPMRCVLILSGFLDNHCRSTKDFPSPQDFRLPLSSSGTPCPFRQPGTLELPREVVCFCLTCACESHWKMLSMGLLPLSRQLMRPVLLQFDGKSQS